MNVVTAASAMNALALLHNGETFDIAVLDMQMPEMDGSELSQRIRRLPQYASMPLVMEINYTWQISSPKAGKSKTKPSRWKQRSCNL